MTTTPDLFAESSGDRILSDGAMLLAGFARPVDAPLLAALIEVAAMAPFRYMVTPGGFTMSAAMTSCGAAGWITDRRGYRYDTYDPDTGRPWPAMPSVFHNLARSAASAAGFPGFIPDSCLLNRYQPGARLTLHQDKNERDFGAPIVSVSPCRWGCRRCSCGAAHHVRTVPGACA